MNIYINVWLSRGRQGTGAYCGVGLCGLVFLRWLFWYRSLHSVSLLPGLAYPHDCSLRHEGEPRLRGCADTLSLSQMTLQGCPDFTEQVCNLQMLLVLYSRYCKFYAPISILQLSQGHGIWGWGHYAGCHSNSVFFLISLAFFIAHKKNLLLLLQLFQDC